MLITKIRTGIKSPIAKMLLFFFFIALFGGFGIAELVRRVMGGRTDGVAMVNGEEISKACFTRKHDEAKEEINLYYKRFGQSASALMAMQGINSNPEESALNKTIQETLLNQVVQKIPVYLSSKYVETKLQDPYFLVSKIYHLMPQDIINHQGRVNIEAFNRFISSYDLRPLEDDLENSLKQEMALTLLSDAFWLPKFALNEMLENQNLQRKFSIATFSIEDAVKKAEEKGVTDAEIKNFFDEQNRKSKHYYIPAKRNGTKWVFDTADFEVKITQKELEEFYNKVKRSRFVEVPTQVKIREIILNDVKNKGLHELKAQMEKLHQKAVAQPSDFAKLAQEHSDAKETAKNGGLVDFFKRGQKDKAIERAAFRLKADGDISPVIQLENGYAIIQRVGRKENVFKPFEKVKPELNKLLKEKKFTREFTKAANRIIHSQSDDKAKKLKEFVEKYKGKEERVPAVAKNENPIALRLFSLKKRGDKVAYISDGKGVILELNDILKKNLPPFDMLKGFVKKDYLNDKARKAIAQEIKKVKAQSFKAGKLEVPAGASVKKTEWIDVNSHDKLKKLFAEGVPQDIMLLDKKGGVISAMGAKDGFVIRLDELKDPENKPEAEKQNQLKVSIEKQLRQLFMSSFIASLNRNATIETYTSSDRRNDSL